MIDRPSTSDWAMWYFVNALDVHSTYEGLKYSCLKEGNPLLPERPSLERLVFHKVVILTWLQNPAYNYQNISKRELRVSTGFIAAVSYNNYRLLDKVQRNVDRCPLR